MVVDIPDTGTSKHIINGDIKVKHGSAIEYFTENGLRFVDGTELQADIIVFAMELDSNFNLQRQGTHVCTQFWWSTQFYTPGLRR